MNLIDDALLIQYRDRIAQTFVKCIKEATSVLDVGCGDGLQWTCYLAEIAGFAVGIDVNLHKQWRNKPTNVDFVLADAKNLPFKNRSFHMVFEKDALHHISGPEKALTEMARVSTHQLIIVEANRYNPISYIHMVRIRKHEHFTREKLKMLLISPALDGAKFFSVEAHYYPAKSRLIASIFLLFQRLLEKILPQNLLNYNIAAVQLKT